MNTKHEQAINVSVQIKCECHNHENFSSNKLNYSLNIENTKIIKTYLIFKAYVCLIQTKVYIHIQNTTNPLNICIKARGSKRINMYI